MLTQTFKFSGGRGQESAFLTTLQVILIHSYSLIHSQMSSHWITYSSSVPPFYPHCHLNDPNHFPQCSGVSLTPIHFISALHVTDWFFFLKVSSNLLCSWIKKSPRATPSAKSLHSCLSSLNVLTYSLTEVQSDRSITGDRTSSMLFPTLHPHECPIPPAHVLPLPSRTISCTTFSVNLFLITWPNVISFSFKP